MLCNNKEMAKPVERTRLCFNRKITAKVLS